MVICGNNYKYRRTCIITKDGYYNGLHFLHRQGLSANDYVDYETVRLNPTRFTEIILPMTFNQENKATLTMGECLAPAMEIKDQQIADQYFKDYVAYLKSNNAWTLEESNAVLLGNFELAETMAKRSLGYYAGYYDNETRERVEKLFGCWHPIFGKLAEMGIPTPEESFQCGYQQKTLAEIRKQKWEEKISSL